MSLQALKQRVADAIDKRDFSLAEQLCDEAKPDLPEAEFLFIRGMLASAQGRQTDACADLARACHGRPDRADIAYNYGVMLQQTGRLPEAVIAWNKTVELDPANASAWVNLALGLALTGRQEEALAIYRQALGHYPAHRDLNYNYANLLHRLGFLRESEDAFQKLLKVYPHDAQVWINLGLTLKSLKQFDEAEACYKKAAVLGDQAHQVLAMNNLAHLLLQQGKWREGFEAYEWRFKFPGSVGNPWNLPPLTPDLPKGSRVLLWNEQGLGDGIMFARFAPLLAAKGYKLFAFAQNSLKRLLATAPCIEAVFCPLDEPQPMDACVAFCSLPYALNLDSVDVWQGPYLSAPATSVFSFDERKPGVKRVGLVWAGNPSYKNDAHRSLRLQDFAPLFDIPSIDWFSLQVGPSVVEIDVSPYRQRVRNLAPYLTDFASTASVVARLDLVISVDSSPAHLAGALGKPVWTLLPQTQVDWRWGLESATTVWYPSMSLFRQPNPNNWEPVFLAMAERLKTFVAV